MTKFIVLHVGYNSGNKASGAEVAITKSLTFQQKYCICALLNLSSKKINEFTSYSYEEFKMIELLPIPFNKPNIVVFHELYRSEFLKIYRECKKKHIPYIIIPHGGLSYTAQKTKAIKKKVANLFLFDSFFKSADAIQFLSLAEKINSRIFSKQETLILGNGIDKPKVLNLQKDEKKLIILYIGRYDIHFKGLDVLLDACRRCKDYMRDKNIIIKMYGTGSNKDEEYLRNYVETNMINDIVNINGPIYDEEKIREYQKANYFIQTSRSEGQPMGILEALSYGTPIIVTPGTTLAEDTKKLSMGITCSLDEYSISDAIKRAYSNKENIGQMSNRAKKYISENFDGDNIAVKTIERYKILYEKGRV
ncbi:glycosyltransferase [Clostridium disporicum]|uniref:Mannosyltransferase n=1 Tax=Clostridium disporicum TaxID=84024 RepID=A0A174L2W6_9CLOT|nr:glycosyltransferase [Clostridium disporicum]CUP17181.1 mannosyltransferase [Clostridium disporicum]